MAIIGSAGSEPAVRGCPLKHRRYMQKAARHRRRWRMRAALGGKVEIPGQQFQIAHHKVAFEDETFFVAFVVKMSLIGRSG